MKFTKMHGLGNDYIYVNAIKEKVLNPAELAIKLSDRHFGIGADGLILIRESDKADFRMEMYNADGSQGLMCGNGIRCAAKYVYDNKMIDRKDILIETLSGIKETIILPEGIQTLGTPKVLVQVNMGVPKIEAVHAQVMLPDYNSSMVYDVDYISMGNPHAVVYVETAKREGGTDFAGVLTGFDITEIGPAFEVHRGKRNRVNTEFIYVADRNTVEMRVWERGSGETFACGTGACASAVSSIVRNLTEREVRIKLLGGDLIVKWSEADGNVYMTGAAETVFEGEMKL